MGEPIRQPKHPSSIRSGCDGQNGCDPHGTVSILYAKSDRRENAILCGHTQYIFINYVSVCVERVSGDKMISNTLVLVYNDGTI